MASCRFGKSKLAKPINSEANSENLYKAPNTLMGIGWALLEGLAL